MGKNSFIRCVVFDLDGTLLNDKKSINASSFDAIKRFLISQSIPIILASGRRFGETKKYIDSIGSRNVLAVICSDGMFSFKPCGELISKSSYIQSDDVVFFVKKYKKAALFTCEKDYFIGLSFSTLLRFLAQRFFKRNKRVAIIRKSQIDKIEKVEKIRIRVKKNHCFNPVFVDRNVLFYRYSANEFDLSNAKTNKYNALISICEKFDISSNAVLFFGNDFNDMLCFKKLANTVSMGNSDALIQNNSSFVTKTNNENGIAFALEHFFSKA